MLFGGNLKTLDFLFNWSKMKKANLRVIKRFKSLFLLENNHCLQFHAGQFIRKELFSIFHFWGNLNFLQKYVYNIDYYRRKVSLQFGALKVHSSYLSFFGLNIIAELLTDRLRHAQIKLTARYSHNWISYLGRCTYEDFWVKSASFVDQSVASLVI